MASGSWAIGGKAGSALVREPALVPANAVDSQGLQRAMAFDVASSAAGRIEIELDGARMTVVGAVAPERRRKPDAAAKCCAHDQL